MFIDTDGIPDDIVGAVVMLALALGNADDVLAEIVGMPEEGDVADTEDMPIAVLFEEFIGSPEGGDTLDEVMLDEIAGKPEGAEVVEATVNELLEGSVGELTEGAEVMLTLGSNVGLAVLFIEIEMLPVGLLVELTPDVEFVVTFGNPLIKWALMVLLSGKGCWLLSLSLKKQFGWSRLSGK